MWLFTEKWLFTKKVNFLHKSCIFTKKRVWRETAPPAPGPGWPGAGGRLRREAGGGQRGQKVENAKVGNFAKIQHFCDLKLKIHFLSKNTENAHFCEFLRFRGPKVLKYDRFYRQTGQGDARFALFAKKCIFTIKVDFWAQNAFLD